MRYLVSDKLSVDSVSALSTYSQSNAFFSCEIWLKPVDTCNACVEDECSSGRHLDCCVSFQCCNGKCQRAYESTGKYPNMSACEEDCGHASYNCNFRPPAAYKCEEVAGSSGQFNSSSACSKECVQPTPNSLELPMLKEAGAA